METKPKLSVKKKILITFAVLIAAYLCVYLLCYFFEPTSFNTADLSKASYSFDRYDVFNKETSPDMYIKQIGAEDVVTAGDEQLKYINNTVILVTDSKTDFDDMTSLAAQVNGEICGYIECADFYQLEFDSYTYSELLNKCSELEERDYVLSAIPDYFEETPGLSASDDEDDSTAATERVDYPADSYAYSTIGLQTAWSYSSQMESVNVGIFDEPVDYTHEALNVVNADEYSIDFIYDGSFDHVFNHGNHVGGIIAGKGFGVCPTAQLYSYNGINNSLSYWVASFARMIDKQNVKVINISMGYNFYVPVAATLGYQPAIDFVEKGNEFFGYALESLINKGREFVICVAAGNENLMEMYRDYSAYFGYDTKKPVFAALDFLSLGIKKAPYGTEARYSFFLTNMKNSAVKDRIIVVGSYNEVNEYSIFANIGSAVDVASPGEMIYSAVLNNSYELMDGTSMATPFVSGTAATLFALDSTLTGAEVKRLIVESANETISYDGLSSYPRLSTGNAVKMLMEK